MKQQSKIIQRKHDKLESLMLRILMNALKETVYDKTLKNVSFTYGKLSSDKRNFNVYVDFYNRSMVPSIVKKLNENKSVFKRVLAENLDVYKIPDIFFKSDESIDRALKVEELIKNTK